MKIACWLMLGVAWVLGMASAPAWGDDAPAPSAAAHAELRRILNRPQYTAWELRQEGEMSAPGSGKWSQLIDEQIAKIREFLTL